MKVKGFKKGANMNFSNASGNGEQVEFSLTNGVSGVMTLAETKTIIVFDDAVKASSVQVFENEIELSVTGRGTSYNTSAISTDSTVEIQASSPTYGYGAWAANLAEILSNYFIEAFTPSRIIVYDCAKRITFRLANFSSFYEGMVQEGNSILNPINPEFLIYYVNISAELTTGGSYTLPIGGTAAQSPTSWFNSVGDSPLFAGVNQSFNTDVANASEVGFGEDFNGTFTINITTEDGSIIVSETITDPNYECETEAPIDDSYPDEPVGREPSFTIIDAKCDEFTISIVPNGNTLGMVNVFLEGERDGNTISSDGFPLGTNLSLDEFSISSATTITESYVIGNQVSLTGNVEVTYTDVNFENPTTVQLPFNPLFENCDNLSEETEEEEEEVVNQKYGCTDSEATNFNPVATNDDGSCSYYEAPENEYLADVSGLTAVLGLTNENYANIIDDTISLIQQLQEDLENCPQDQTGQVAQLTQELATAEEQLEDLQGADAMLIAVQDTIDNIANAPCDLEDPATQATFTALKQANVGAETIEALRTLCTGNDNITIDDVNAATSDLNLALGVIQDILGNAVPDSTTSVVVENLVTLENDIQAAIDALQANQEDGVSQADVDAAEAAAEAAYDVALNLQAGELGAINIGLQAQITLLTNQVPLDAAAAAAAQDLALLNLQAEFDALGLVYTEAEMDALIQETINGITPEDGVTADTVLAAEAVLQAIIDTMFTEVQLDAAELAATQAAEQVAAQAAEALAVITAQNIADAQAAYDLALAAAQGVSYQQGYGDGADSVDITTDNQQAIDAAMAFLAEGDEVYDAIFAEGAASITPEDGVSQADLDAVQALLDAANDAIASGGTGAAYDTLMDNLDTANQQLANATATNQAYEVFIQGVDTSMSRLERFLTDSYSYEAYDRSSLAIPANMQDVNPNFNNETPSLTSTYIGDGTNFGNTSTYNDNLASQFGEFSGGGKKAKSHSSFAYMMGKANHMREGFMNYSGELPFSRMDGNDDDADSTEEGFELTEGTKTGLWIFGGAIAAFGLYKVLKKK